MSVNWTDASTITPDERRQLLGPEFFSIHVLRIGFGVAGGMRVECILNGRVTTLIGDPQEALATYLGGQEEGEAEH